MTRSEKEVSLLFSRRTLLFLGIVLLLLFVSQSSITGNFFSTFTRSFARNDNTQTIILPSQQQSASQNQLPNENQGVSSLPQNGDGSLGFILAGNWPRSYPPAPPGRNPPGTMECRDGVLAPAPTCDEALANACSQAETEGNKNQDYQRECKETCETQNKKFDKVSCICRTEAPDPPESPRRDLPCTFKSPTGTCTAHAIAICSCNCKDKKKEVLPL